LGDPVLFLSPAGYNNFTNKWYDYSGNNNHYDVYGDDLTQISGSLGWKFNGTNNFLSGSSLNTWLSGSSEYTILTYFTYDINTRTQAFFQKGQRVTSGDDYATFKFEPTYKPWTDGPYGAITCDGRAGNKKIGSITKVTFDTMDVPATSMFAYVNSASISDSTGCDPIYPTSSTGYFNSDRIYYYTGSSGGININGAYYNDTTCDSGSSWVPTTLGGEQDNGSLIGKYSVGGSVLANYIFKGIVIYNRNLTDTEIKYTYNQFTASYGIT
jgi:hypothetical protein